MLKQRVALRRLAWHLLYAIFMVSITSPVGIGSAQSKTNSAQPSEITEQPFQISDKDDRPLKQIFSARMHAKYPIGIVIGKQPQSLCKTNDSQFIQMTAHDALQKIAAESGFLLSEEDGMYLIEDPSIAPWMQSILSYRMETFPAFHHVTMNYLGATLIMWMRSSISNVHDFGGEMRGSDNIKFYDLDESKNMTIQEIASKIAALDPKVIWVMRPLTESPKDVNDIEFRFVHLKDLDFGGFVCRASPAPETAK